jgi:hypothetical protein
MRVDISYSDAGNGRGAALFEETVSQWFGPPSFDETSYQPGGKHRVLTWIDHEKITARKLLAVTELGRAQKLRKVEVEVKECWC